MKRNYFFLFFFTVFVFVSSFLAAQSNEVIDTLLGEKNADIGRTTYMVLCAASMINENTDIPGAFAVLKEKHWPGFKTAAVDSNVTMEEYAYMLMKAFDISGGVMYHFFPGPRYAYRELVYKGFINKGTDPSENISGESVVRILGYVLNWKEEQE